MGQPGFFDLQHRYEGLDAKSDPLVAILAAVPFELFRVKLKTALVKGGLRKAAVDRKSAAGRKPWDESTKISPRCVETNSGMNGMLARCGD